ncbi:hypothetical protein C8R44DRAFT_875827 [Mycena epipterygia]|nr:hypothetical protein C8R44DRAFT_875827 [Mycena epipterygia]
MSLESLSEDVFLVICIELDVPDIISLRRGYTDPIAEAYLPGQVRTTASGVLAFGLGPKAHPTYSLCGTSLSLIRQNVLDLYTKPLSSASPIYIKSIKTIPIWEVTSFSPPSSQLRLLVLSPTGLCTPQPETMFNVHAVCAHDLLATASPSQWASEALLYHLHVSGTSRRTLCLAVGDRNDPEYKMGGCIPPSCIHTYCFTIIGTAGPSYPLDAHDPALWAFPALDFDEALGFTVIGNCFGELAIYDPT